MPNQNSIVCLHCNFLNVTDDVFCQRCNDPLPDVDLSNKKPTQEISHKPPTDEYQLQNQDGFEQWKDRQKTISQTFERPQRQKQPVIDQRFSSSVFRHNDEFVIHKSAQMPERCVKCNEYVSKYNSGSFATQNYRWHHPLIYLALLSPVIYVILSFILSQKVTLKIPLCNEHIEKRNTVGNYLAGGGIAAIIGVIGLAFAGFGGFAFILFMFSVIGLIIGNDFFYKPLTIAKIENEHIYLKGAGIEFLNETPQQ